jgi:2-polyprenyl-3-methyl-5-hydroxy-6-metoxy-1,4-benzoquinol methylase
MEPIPGHPSDSIIQDTRYAELIAREAAHWGSVNQDPENPQLWDDPRLWQIVLERPYAHLIERALKAGGPALELGCGDGDLALALARRGLDVTGIDLSPARVERARDIARRELLEGRARYQTGDLNVCPLPQRAFGCVIAHDALHHVLRVEALLDRVRGALRPGGRLLVSDFQGAGWLEKLASAATVAALPTRLPYARKWRLRGRLRALLASERAKRESLARDAPAELHDASPFESISQTSIVPAIAARFEIVEQFTFCPYWYNVVPRLLLPAAWKHALLAACQRVDGPLNRRGWTRGCYVFVEARSH